MNLHNRMESRKNVHKELFAGIGMDTCVIPLRHGGLSLVQTTDYIYPIVDDPYMMVSLTLRTFTSGIAYSLGLEW